MHHWISAHEFGFIHLSDLLEQFDIVSSCWYFKGICMSFWVLRSEYSVFWDTDQCRGLELIRCLWPPCLHVACGKRECTRIVRELLWLHVPQELPVNLKAPTSGCSLPLFALSSACRPWPPWLRGQRWPNLLCARPGEVQGLCSHLVWGSGLRDFRLGFIFVSAPPFERDSCNQAHIYHHLSLP